MLCHTHLIRSCPFIASLALVGCASSSRPPLYEGLGDTARTVSVDVDLAQDYFDQGLALCWGFNHDEAQRAFEEVGRIDPDCAMAEWGVAYTLGPNLNRPLTDPERATLAHEAAQRALAMSADASELERALIEALSTRFAVPPPEDRGELDRAYADAMAGVWARYPDDPLVGTLYADALMNLSLDWRAWGTDEERGEDTPLIVETLEHVLSIAPDHAGANHFYIHAVEGSNRPERALDAANKLEGLMPAAGHMVHMPSHIYIRLGMYDEAIESNARSVVEDDRFFAQAPRQGIYHMYRAHNHHFLSWAAMFRGSSERALEAARAMESKLPDDVDDPGMRLEAYRFVPMHVMMRFGMWDEMLDEPAPEHSRGLATALWHHGRAVALANTGRLRDAREEVEHFERAAATIPSQITVRRTPIGDLLETARLMMWGEILFKEGDHEAAFAALRQAVEAEDSMPYAEPPSWMQPVRHSLGALLLEAGHVEEAEAVYRADLERHANNVWSLHGLRESLQRQGRTIEAISVEARFNAAAQHADVPIRSSCFCRNVDA